MEGRLQALWHKDAIRELTARYCRAVIAGDGAGLAALFVEDGGIESAGEWIRGRDALAGFINGLPSGTLFPMIHNHVIDLDGGEARGYCVVESPSGGLDGQGFVAEYDDTYRLEQDQWRFVERRIRMLKTGL